MNAARPVVFGVALAAIAVVASACGDGSPSPALPATTIRGTTTVIEGTVVGEFAEPITLLPRHGDDHLWIAERAGTVRRVAIAADGTLDDGTVVADLTDETTTDVERGLLSIAFSPDGTRLYTSSTDLDGNTVVAARPLTGSPVTAGDPTVLFTAEQPYPNHNGGHLEVTDDGTIWLGLGDGGAADDPENRAQDDSTPLGKLLSIDPTTGTATKVAKGLRNPWRFAFDTDGSIWIADVGQNRYEEIDHVARADLDGANFGWSGYEGSHEHLDGDGRRPADPVMPVYEYDRSAGDCSIIGGFPYHGTELTELDGTFLFTDYCRGAIRALRLGSGTADATAISLGVDVTQPISFGRDTAGEVYVLSDDGTVTRLGHGA